MESGGFSRDIMTCDQISFCDVLISVVFTKARVDIKEHVPPAAQRYPVSVVGTEYTILCPIIQTNAILFHINHPLYCSVSMIRT